MLSSAWLADTADEDEPHHHHHHHHDVEAGLGDPMVPEQFLEVDMNNFYLPTPPESSELWQDNLLPAALTAGIKVTRASSTPQRRLYCPRCTKAFSRTDSLRRHEKLYCRNRSGEHQHQQQQQKPHKPQVKREQSPASS